MATDDQQVLVAGTAVAPAIWKVPGNGQIQPKAVFAHYDGSGAAAAFLPALKVTSDGGELVGIYPTCTEVAAGGSAEVSWFPGVKCCPQAGSADYNAAVLALQPWAYWKLSEPAGSTTAADSSGHSRTLTTIDGSGAATFGVTGLVTTSPQTCAHITYTSASNVYPLETAANPTYTASAVTVEAWVETTGGTGHEETIASFGRLDTESTWWLMLDTSGQPTFSFLDSISVRRSATWTHGIADGLPHHVLVSFSGASASCYVDGALVSTQAMGGALNVPATHTGYVGGVAGGAVGRLWDGKIGPVVVYDQALTPEQVANLYNQGAGGAGGTGGVATVTAGDSSVVMGGTASNVTVETASLDVIATDHPAAADWSNNSHKITSVADPSALQDAATKNYVDTHGGGITALASPTSTITVTNPAGPTADVDLPASGVTAATYGDSSHVPQVAVDARGRITSASNVAIGSGSSLIAKQVLNASAATLSVGSIPATYGSLQIVIYARTDYAGAVNDNINITLNGDTSSLYNYIYVFFGTTSGTVSNSGTFMQFPCDCAGGNASVFAPHYFVMPQYAGTVGFKSMTGHGDNLNRDSSHTYVLFGSGMWRSTAAVTSIALAPAAGANFVAGSALYVYGLAA